MGRKFRRQHSVTNYILDFYCPTERLSIELDGSQHYTDKGLRYDKERTSHLNQLSIKVIRFENKLVFDRIDIVLEEICKCFKDDEQQPPPRPRAATPPEKQEGS